MSNVERDTYLAIREGMQVFQGITELLSDKIGLRQKLISTPSSELTGNQEIDRLRGFCHDYATYGTSLYVSKRWTPSFAPKGVESSEKKADLSDLPLSLDSAQPEKAVIRRLLAPIYAYLAVK